MKKITDITNPGEYHLRRMWEIIPGLLTWSALFAPVILSLIAPSIVAFFVICFDLFWLFRAFYMSRNLLYAYNRLNMEQNIDWLSRLEETQNLYKTQEQVKKEIIKLQKKTWLLFPFNIPLRISAKLRKKIFYLNFLKDFYQEIKNIPQEKILNYREIYQLVILATYKEDINILRQSIQAIVDSNFPNGKILFVLATEERDKTNATINALTLEKEFKDKFGLFMWTMHPKDTPGEIVGKGGNITHAARQVKKVIDERNIPYENIITTTLDADNKVHPQYFPSLTYKYIINPKRTRRSFQPVPIFNNNIWDVPAPTRVVAMGNSFWQLMESTRPERLRNFSSHAQSFKTLVDTDFWSVTTIVEDGHQFWRTFFTYEGDHAVIPVFLPVYQDAVLGKNYWDTLKAQYIQLRRWAWGASDLAYVVLNFQNNKKISLTKKVVSIYRIIEGYFLWATAPLFITFTAWLPGLLNPQFKYSVLAHNLPIITSRILTVAMIGFFVNVLIASLLLPKRPARYTKFRHIAMLAQWILLPIVTIFFSSIPAIDSQTRLMIGKRLDWQVTKKIRRE
ncbi:hypothetical protein COZ97_02960 [bacterium CG_4_8_14_3_um_filter_33_28]|nr:MAG: hypothetical protein COZ97_02960 [bacterium CG_4_8_14_3_um_filter_33_28]